MKIKLTDCSETSAHKIQTAGNRPKERIQHSENGESLKSRIHQLLTSPRKSIDRSFRPNFETKQTEE